jgi:hypothetical protein
MPAKAGIQSKRGACGPWTPAFAGVTVRPLDWPYPISTIVSGNLCRRSAPRSPIR